MASGNSLGALAAISFVASTSVTGTNPKVVNNRTVHQFDPSTQWACEAVWTIPRNYSAATGISFTVQWEGDTATTGNVLWAIAIERNAAGGNAITSDNFATAVNAGGGAAAVNGSLGKLSYTTVALTNGTQLNGALVGESVRVRLIRVAADASDTMAGFANFVNLEIQET